MWLGVLLYEGYLAVFFGTWTVNRVDYTRIGENAETTKLWYALPTLLGCAFLVVAISVLGWWRLTLFDTLKSGPKWVWILPAVMAFVIGNNFLGVSSGKLSAALLLWSALGAVGVGFGEEMATRGSMIVGLRSKFGEPAVWLLSTLSFSALHVPNVIFGLPMSAMPIVPMILHGLWDSALFLNVATGVTPSNIQYVVYPVAAACVTGVLLKNRNAGMPS